MKNYSGSYYIKLIGLLLVVSIFACDDDLDYVNDGAINPENVWNDKGLINGFLSDIHGNMIPGWPVNGNSSDEAVNGASSMSNYLRGIVSVEDQGQSLNYTNIDKINFFLDKVPAVDPTILTDVEKDQLMGQAYFWRAWDYFGKVRTLGGVPLILQPQDVTNVESLLVSRNKTSECIAQIVNDLDVAIGLLPPTWTDADYGRIDKCAAMAFKGIVLLYYASPQFNPTADDSRWQAAYTANKAAIDFLTAQGKGLMEDYDKIWSQEQNKEGIMVSLFYNPDRKFSQANVKPEVINIEGVTGASNSNQITLALLNAFPKTDGSTIEFDESQLSDPVYNKNYLNEFYFDRDDRFYSSIFIGGTQYPVVVPGFENPLWATWKRLHNEFAEDDGKAYKSMQTDQFTFGFNPGVSSFFQRKGIDKEMANNQGSETDWLEIRYAEVLMNYGESANEIGKYDEALQVLYAIRERAGIEPGSDGGFGITATDQTGIREAYINERFVEFALEGKRFSDLRR